MIKFQEGRHDGGRSNDNAVRQFQFPHEVVEDPSLSFSRKREILSEWASDACAVESFPTLRLLPGTRFPVTYSAIMDARRRLDRLAEMAGETGTTAPAFGQVIAADFARRQRARHAGG